MNTPPWKSCTPWRSCTSARHCYVSFISAAPEKHRCDRRTFADCLAEHAGFSDAEIRRMEHLRDGQSPAGGWVLL